MAIGLKLRVGVGLRCMLYTYISHNACIAPFLNNGRKQAHPVLYYFLLSFTVMPHLDPESLKKKEPSPSSKDERNPSQSIMFCLLMIDSWIRTTITRERQQAWQRVNQLSMVATWRTAQLWLEFSIRASSMHRAAGEGCRERNLCRRTPLPAPVSSWLADLSPKGHGDLSILLTQRVKL